MCRVLLSHQIVHLGSWGILIVSSHPNVLSFFFCLFLWNCWVVFKLMDTFISGVCYIMPSPQLHKYLNEEIMSSPQILTPQKMRNWRVNSIIHWNLAVCLTFLNNTLKLLWGVYNNSSHPNHSLIFFILSHMYGLPQKHKKCLWNWGVVIKFWMVPCFTW